MGYGDDNALEFVQIVLQHRQGADVQIIGRLVQDQHIGRFHEQTQQVQPPLLPAGQPGNLRPLLLPVKKEPLQHGRCGDDAVLRPNILGALPHILDGLQPLIQRFVFLGKIGDLHRTSEIHTAGIRLQVAGEHLQQRTFAAAVSSHDTDAVAFQKNIGKIVKQHFAVIGLGNMFRLDGLAPQPGGHGTHLHLLLRHIRCLDLLHLLNALDMGFLFGGTGSGAPHEPLQLRAQDALALPLRGDLHILPLCFQLHKPGVAAGVAVKFSVIDLHDPGHHPIQKIPVVGHQHNGAPEFQQIIFQPLGHFIIQMVGGLVQDQDIPLAHEHPDKGRPFALSAGQLLHRLAKIRQIQFIEHSLSFRLSRPPVICGCGHIAFQCRFQHRISLLEHRCLGQIRNFQIVAHGDLSVVTFLLPGQNLQQGGFAGAVHTDDPDLLPLLNGKIHLIENLPLSVCFCQLFCCQ